MRLDRGEDNRPEISFGARCRIGPARFVVFMKATRRTGGTAMWDTVQTSQEYLSHDLPCLRCGHAAHTYLACSDTCACVPAPPPGVPVEEYVAA
jgi:hypothetical protein